MRTSIQATARMRQPNENRVNSANAERRRLLRVRPLWILVAPEQTSCPNCGITDPSDRFFWKTSGYDKPPSGHETFVASIVMGGGAALLVGLLAMLPIWPAAWAQDFAQHARTAAFAVGGLTSGVLLLAGLYNNRQARHRREDCFQQIEESLQQRMTSPRALLESEQPLVTRLEELRREHQPAAELERALETVRKALDEAQAQSREAQVLCNRILMLRAQNQLEPLLLDPATEAPPAVCQERLSRLETIRRQAAESAARFEQLRELHECADAAPLREDWKALLGSCQRLKDCLLAQQAVAAIDDATPLTAEVTSEGLAEATARARAILTHDFGDFASAVTELRERERKLTVASENSTPPARQLTRE